MFGTLFMSKKKKEQLAAEKREQEYKQFCDAQDRIRWAKVSEQQLNQLLAAMSNVYRFRSDETPLRRPEIHV